MCSHGRRQRQTRRCSWKGRSKNGKRHGWGCYIRVRARLAIPFIKEKLNNGRSERGQLETMEGMQGDSCTGDVGCYSSGGLRRVGEKERDERERERERQRDRERESGGRGNYT